MKRSKHPEDFVVLQKELGFETQREGQAIDITHTIKSALTDWNVGNGLVHIFVIGSTGSVISIESEKGLLDHDIVCVYDRIAPELDDEESQHQQRWRDGNAHSHIRASIFGPGILVPVENGRLKLGPWQQIVLVEFDIKPHERRLELTFLGRTLI
jgi:secondary thiamine-phosphate synthase enzyme